MKRSPFPVGRERANKVGQLIHADVCGSMHVSTPGGAKFFVLFPDDRSGWRAVYLLKQKSQIAESFKDFVNWNFGEKPLPAQYTHSIASATAHPHSLPMKTGTVRSLIFLIFGFLVPLPSFIFLKPKDASWNRKVSNAISLNIHSHKKRIDFGIQSVEKL